jgi:hypothetical protein
MKRRPPLIALLLAILCVVLAAAMLAHAETQPPSLQHGHIAEHLTTKTHAYLAIQLSIVPNTPQRIDYVQWVDYLVGDGYVLRNGAVISRSVYTSDATPDGWLFLKLAKPCAPGEIHTDYGLVTVCPPDDGHGVVDACVNPTRGITPVFNGVPPELEPCPAPKRRAVRK